MAAKKRKKDPKRVAAGRRARNKGKRFERFFARIMRRIFGETVHRGDQRRCGGAGVEEGADVDGVPWWSECKHEMARPSPWDALRQAADKQAEKGDTRPAIAVIKTDKKPKGWQVGQPAEPPLVCMSLDTFVDLVGEWWYLRERYGYRIDTCDDEPGEPEDPRNVRPFSIDELYPEAAE